MKTQFLQCTAILMLSSVLFASPRSYEILLPKNTDAGPVQLAAGHYRFTVEGSSVIFTNLRTSQAVVAHVRIATTKEHQATSVEVQTEDGRPKIISIDLEGSNETLEFGG